MKYFTIGTGRTWTQITNNGRISQIQIVVFRYLDNRHFAILWRIFATFSKANLNMFPLRRQCRESTFRSSKTVHRLSIQVLPFFNNGQTGPSSLTTSVLFDTPVVFHWPFAENCTRGVSRYPEATPSPIVLIRLSARITSDSVDFPPSVL